MARIKIDFPSQFNFSTELTLRISDINYGGHLGNDATLSLIHEARLRFLKHYGYDEYNLAGVSFIMVDCAVVYKSEGFHGDLIEIQVTAADFTKHGFDLLYCLSNTKTEKRLAHAKTGMVCFDYTEKKIRPVPIAFKTRFT